MLYPLCQAEWERGEFRDCNGVHNGLALAGAVVAAEQRAGPHQGRPAGSVGPPPVIRREQLQSMRERNMARQQQLDTQAQFIMFLSIQRVSFSSI